MVGAVLQIGSAAEDIARGVGALVGADPGAGAAVGVEVDGDAARRAERIGVDLGAAQRHGEDLGRVRKRDRGAMFVAAVAALVVVREGEGQSGRRGALCINSCRSHHKS